MQILIGISFLANIALVTAIVVIRHDPEAANGLASILMSMAASVRASRKVYKECRALPVTFGGRDA
jgi:hypothetical protein